MNTTDGYSEMLHCLPGIELSDIRDTCKDCDKLFEEHYLEDGICDECAEF